VANQNNGINSLEIPPSPIVSQFTKYGNHPVSLNSGILKINVPLFQLRGYHYSLDANLSYHASGIRVTDVASREGLGWTLNVGGTISRIVRAKPDEMVNYGYWALKDQGIYEFENGMPQISNDDDYLTLLKLSNGELDGEPDLFSYNFNEGSGKFFIEREGEEYKVVFLEESDIEATTQVSNNEIISFTFATATGNKYLFNVKENSIFNEMEYNSAWHLKEITNSFGSDIQFIYEPEIINNEILTKVTDFYRPCQFKRPIYNFNLLSTHGWRIKNIISNKDKIIFDYAERTDLLGSGKLTKITHRIDGKDKLFIVFHHTYFNGEKLKLDHITFKDPKNEGEEEKYSFLYSDINLPDISSNSQDFWGYFNGASNTNLLPYSPYFNKNTSFADREVNENYNQAGILKKIVYPTGGSSTFEYESNKATYEVEGYKETIELNLEKPNFEPFGFNQFSDVIQINVDGTLQILNNMTYTHPFGEEIYLRIILLEAATDEVVETISLPKGTSYIFNDLKFGDYKLAIENLENIEIEEVKLNVFYEFFNDRITTVSRTYGGLRVKNLISSDGGGNFAYKTYRYSDPKVLNDITNESHLFSTTDLLILPSGDCGKSTLAQECITYGRTETNRFSFPSQIISYGTVREYNLTELPNESERLFHNGYIQYEYYHPLTFGGGSASNISSTELDYTTELLKRKASYDSEGVLLEEESYKYEYVENKPNGLIYLKASMLRDHPCFDGLEARDNNYDQLFFTYAAPTVGWAKLIEAEQITYDPENKTSMLLAKKSYSYNIGSYNPNIIKIETPSEIRHLYNLYAKDYLISESSPTFTLYLQNYPNALIEQVETIIESDNSYETIISAFKYTYLPSTYIFKSEVFVYEPTENNTIDNYKFTNGFEGKPLNNIQPLSDFINHNEEKYYSKFRFLPDTYGYIKSVVDNTGITTNYYRDNDRQIVAIANEIMPNSGLTAESSVEDFLSSSSLFLKSYYRYDSRGNIIKSYDTNGKYRSYQYDYRNRLIKTLDNDDNIINRVIYHIKEN
jgi:hypothetical protein